MESHGRAAERLVDERIRAALPADAFGLYPNAEWLGSMREGGPPRDGEADLVIVHAEHGILVLETKSGTPSRDHAGHWWIGNLALDRDPFTQAKDSKHQLVRKLAELADWPPRTEPRAGHAIALPDVDLASLPRGHVLLGADAPRELVLDAEALETPASIRRWVEGAFAYWLGDGSKGVAARCSRRPSRRRAPRPDLGAPSSRARAHRGRPGGAPRDQPRAGAHRQPDEDPAPARGRGPGGKREVDARRRESPPAGARGVPDAPGLLQPAPRDEPHPRARGGAGPGGPRRDDVPPPVRAARHRGGRPPGAPRPDPAGLVGRDAPGRAGGGDRRAARPALPRGRRRRGPGLRGPLVRAPAAPARRSRATSSGSSTTRARRSSGPTSWPGSASSATSSSRTTATRSRSPRSPAASIAAARKSPRSGRPAGGTR